MATWWFRDLYTQICIYTDYPSRLPGAKRKEKKRKERRYRRHGEVVRTTANTQRTQTVPHTCLTHIYIDQSKQGPRDYVWAGKQFCMEHTSTPFYYRLRTDCPSPNFLFSTIIILLRTIPLFPESSSISRGPFRLFIFPVFLFQRRLKTHACMYTLHIYLISLWIIFLLPTFSTASTISRACNAVISLLRMTCISCHDDNS